ncbi:MAG TPA: energy-coupling factor transporter transmembrane component T [Candidatus Cloacimonadota bacterium]|jgi:energy-coupling factor transporter transmembrane protein EcfT|nr:energy-coupling factor transporter transmembrane component T [Candidatus Cloacimonadota bacterium]
MKRLLHPLSYIVICVFYSSLAIVISNPLYQILLFLLAWLLDWREGSEGMGRRLIGLQRYLWLFLSVMLIQLLFTRRGVPILNLGILSIHSDGITMAAVLGLRLAVVYMVANSLSKMDFTLYRAAFAKIRLPEELSFMISYMAHLVPQLQINFRTQMQELKLRGILVSKLPIKEKLEIYKIISIATVAEIIVQSSSQAIALELRGFRSKGKRSSLNTLNFTYRDLFAPLWVGLWLLLVLV